MNVTFKLPRIKRLTSRRAIAQAVKDIVLAEEQYNQKLWLSGRYFPNEEMIATGEELREIMGQNRCGTQGCVAGNVVVLTLPRNWRYDYAMDDVIDPEGNETYVHDYARAKLGLPDDDAIWLFGGGRTVEEVIKALDLIIAGKRSIKSLYK